MQRDQKNGWTENKGKLIASSLSGCIITLVMIIFLFETINTDITIKKPESYGFSSSKLKQFKKNHLKNNRCFLVMDKKGYIIFQHNNIHENVNIRSLKKMILNALIGRLWDEQKINLNSTIENFEIDHPLTPLSSYEKQSTILDLLKSRSGVYVQAIDEMSYYIQNKPFRGAHRPGEYWYYNNWGFEVLGFIATKISRQSIEEQIKTYFFTKIGVHDKPEIFSIKNSKFNYSDFGIKISAYDISNFSRIFLLEPFNDQILLSKIWIKKSTTSYSNLKSLGGYGLLFWIARKGWHFGQNIFSEKAVSGWGEGGQHIVILLESELILTYLNLESSNTLGNFNTQDAAEVFSNFMKTKQNFIEKSMYKINQLINNIF